MNIIDKLPHKAPALLLTDVVEIDESCATCRISQKPDESIAPGGLLPAPVGLEAVAQCAAVWMCRRFDADEIHGMLVQCRNYEMKVRQLDVTTGLTAVARPLSVDSLTGLYLFSGEIRDGTGKVLACGNFMIYSKD